MMTSLPRRTLDSANSMLAGTLYHGNHDRNNNLWNILSTARHILHMQEFLNICYIYTEKSQLEHWTHHFRRKRLFIVFIYLFTSTYVQHDVHFRWRSCRFIVTRWVSHVARECTPDYKWGSCCTIFNIENCCVARCLSFCPSSFGHCVVCPPYLQVSDYPLVSSNFRSNSPSLSISFCIRINAWSRSSGIFGIFYFKFNRIDLINIITKVGNSKWLVSRKASSIWWFVKFKSGASMLSFFLEKPMHDVCL